MTYSLIADSRTQEDLLHEQENEQLVPDDDDLEHFIDSPIKTDAPEQTDLEKPLGNENNDTPISPIA
jgi:hypothetical protein